MGEQNVKKINDEATHQEFMKSLLGEVHALETMLERGLVESGIARIGAEQEMFLIDKAHKPATKAMEILEVIDDERFTHELGLFNLEANLSPHELGGNCLSLMEKEAQEVYRRARETAAQVDCDIALVGILPTLTKNNLGLESMVPTPRYYALNDAIRALRGDEFRFTINGIDQLSVKHDNVMLEACNTSFQVHFQVSPENFARNYNIAQVITAPLLAAAVNSPILLGKRLWHETRIAVFEYSIDTRSKTHQERGLKPRVHFGDRWLEDSVTEIFKEDIARFRIVLTTETEEDPVGMIDRGVIPSLNALRLHNGTVYRWNRPCYGVHNNVPHLRIENRVIPSGPTVLDEIANAAFFYGMMLGMTEQVPDIRELLTFADVKSNFLAAARDGIRAQMNWFNDTHLPAKQLVLEQLLPLAREGLQEAGIDRDDIDRYLGVLHERVAMRRTGARWALESLEEMKDAGTQDQRLRCIVSSMVEQQSSGKPISQWELAEYCVEQDWRDSYLTVGQFMTQDLFTVRPDDIVDFAATLMDWRHIRHVPVENDNGKLVGLVSHRALLRLMAQGRIGKSQSVSVEEIMNREPVTVSPDTPTVEAIRMMRENDLACLPVTRKNKLVGIVTEHDLIIVASHLLESYLARKE
ncbi:MAG: CBS domain-containing protein [Xanthomonadales bacterium]|nr:CBS domain-containing protein [Gammaproteobacteria bacterium]MBT8052736.1 CBS domain-containing protein [Gammaproteobacteria bacterium]NND55908.1 CBS domain-containing protein [Xanthomonadales bacterium]NNK50606.1 CBS domain-containing protein [Xanthomonadales bacterium]